MSDFLITFPILLAFTWIGARRIRHFGPNERPLLWLSFFAHQLAGMVNIGITKLYYGYGDMLTYYRFGLFVADRLRSDFWGLAPGLIGLIFRRPDPLPIPVYLLSPMSSTGSLQGLSSFLMYFFLDSLYAACAFIAGFAFLSKLALYAVTSEELPDVPKRPLLWACMLAPSALYWSCSLLKEPFAMIGLLTAIHGWHQLMNRRNVLRSTVLGIAGSVTVILIKGYLFPVLGIAIGTWYLAHSVHKRRGDIAMTLGHAAIAAAAIAGIIAITGALLPRFSVDTLGDSFAGVQNVGARVRGGSTYALNVNAGLATTQVGLAPLGLLTALFRPTLVEVTNPLVLVSAIEMTFFLVATLIVPFRRGIPAVLSELVQKPFLGFCAMFVVVFGTCVGLGTTNLGTLSRYRMPLIPFFAILLVALLARPKAVSAKSQSTNQGPGLAPSQGAVSGMIAPGTNPVGATIEGRL